MKKESDSKTNKKNSNRGRPGFDTLYFRRAREIQIKELKNAKNMEEVMLAHRRFEENQERFRKEERLTTYKEDFMLFVELGKEHTEYWKNRVDPSELLAKSEYNKLLFEWRKLHFIINKAERIFDHDEWDLTHLLTPLYALEKRFINLVKKEGWTFDSEYLIKNKLKKTKPKGISIISARRYKKVHEDFVVLDNKYSWKKLEMYEYLSAHRKFYKKVYSPGTIRDIIERKKYLQNPVEKPPVKK